jgi:AraC-like DNA-binding protein
MDTDAPVDVPLIRYAYVTDYLAQLDAANVSYASTARQSRLPLLVADPRDFVAKRPLWRFVTLAARTAGQPLLGLYAGQFTVTDGHAVTVVDRARAAGPTLRDGVSAFMRLAQQEANEFPGGVMLRAGGIWPWQRGLTPNGQDPPGAEQMELFLLGALLGMIRRYLGEHWVPPVVCLQNQVCPRGLADALGGTQILTGQPILAIKIPFDVLATRCSVRGVDADGNARRATDPATDLVDGLRQALTTSFPDAAATRITLDFAAELARTSPRTLQRRLADHGLRFRDLLDQSLAQSAGRFLADAGMPIYDIAHMHGYSDVTHFSRAFRRATTKSPGEYRRELLERAR